MPGVCRARFLECVPVLLYFWRLGSRGFSGTTGGSTGGGGGVLGGLARVDACGYRALSDEGSGALVGDDLEVVGTTGV